MTAPKNRLSSLALRSFEIVRLSLRIALSYARVASLRLLMALMRAALFLARLIGPSNASPTPKNDPCTPGK